MHEVIWPQLLNRNKNTVKRFWNHQIRIRGRCRCRHKVRSRFTHGYRYSNTLWPLTFPRVLCEAFVLCVASTGGDVIVAHCGWRAGQVHWISAPIHVSRGRESQSCSFGLKEQSRVYSERAGKFQSTPANIVTRQKNKMKVWTVRFLSAHIRLQTRRLLMWKDPHLLHLWLWTKWHVLRCF